MVVERNRHDRVSRIEQPAVKVKHPPRRIGSGSVAMGVDEPLGVGIKGRFTLKED